MRHNDAAADVQRPAPKPGLSRTLGLTLLTTIGILATSCASDDTYLPTLLEDPMASYQAEGIERIDSWERAEGRDPFFRKPTHAEVGRTYRIVEEGQVDQVLKEAVVFAEAAAWRMQPSQVKPDTLYIGAKKLGPGNGRLSIALGAADPLHDPDGPRVLSIYLDFGPVRFDDTTTSVAEHG